MDLMMRRSVLLASGKKAIDTSPKIIQYGVRYPLGNPLVKPLIDDENGCITDFYEVGLESNQSAIVITDYGLYGAIVSFNDDIYRDYWTADSRTAEQTKIGIPSRTTRVAFSVVTSLIDDCYCFIQLTGQILFAGKNSPYYGYTNINDMPT